MRKSATIFITILITSSLATIAYSDDAPLMDRPAETSEPAPDRDIPAPMQDSDAPADSSRHNDSGYDAAHPKDTTPPSTAPAPHAPPNNNSGHHKLQVKRV